MGADAADRQVLVSSGEFLFDPEALPHDQRHQALTNADELGWLSFQHITPGRPSVRRYVIEVGGLVVLLRPGDVLPYVRGHADARGAGHLFPMREDTPPV